MSYSQITKNAKLANEQLKSPTCPSSLPKAAASDVVQNTIDKSCEHIKVDSEISHSFARANERELKPWVPDCFGPSTKLEHITSPNLQKKGKSPTFDQFAVNRELFGIVPTYDESQYTTSLDRSHPEYKWKEAQAEKIAKEIMKIPTKNPHLAEERGQTLERDSSEGLDEESRYGAVIRGPNAYIPPSLRNKSASLETSSKLSPLYIKNEVEIVKKEEYKKDLAPETIPIDLVATGNATAIESYQRNEILSDPEMLKVEKLASKSKLDEMNGSIEGAEPVVPVATESETAPSVNESELGPDEIKEKVLSFKLNPKAAEFKPIVLNYAAPCYPMPSMYPPPMGPYFNNMIPQHYPHPQYSNQGGIYPGGQQQYYPPGPYNFRQYPNRIVPSYGSAAATPYPQQCYEDYGRRYNSPATGSAGNREYNYNNNTRT